MEVVLRRELSSEHRPNRSDRRKYSLETGAAT